MRASVRSILLYVYIHNIPDMIILVTLDRYRVHYATLMQVFCLRYSVPYVSYVLKFIQQYLIQFHFALFQM